VLQPLVFDPLRRLQQGGHTGNGIDIDDRQRLWVAVDGMGGDHAPGPILEGCLRAVNLLPLRIRFVAEPALLHQAVETMGLGHDLEEATQCGLIELVPSGPSVGMNEEATVVRRKRDASINVAMDLVKQGKATAVYSAGNSGAVMAAAIFRLGRLAGIDRPAIGALFPTKDPSQQVLVLDVGANMDCKPEWLHQFALLGNIYSRDVLQVQRPRIGLVNIGEEECKGNDLCLRTHPLLAGDDRFVFAGNCEGRDILSGDFDVVVCDGFTGNVLLKFLESAIASLEYAVSHLGVPVIVVLGHAACGAVAAAFDRELSLTPSLAQVVGQLRMELFSLGGEDNLEDACRHHTLSAARNLVDSSVLLTDRLQVIVMAAAC